MRRGNRTFHAKAAFEVGSQPPSGYVAWHEWAAAQGRGGLRQRQCRNCGRWRFPQEMAQVGVLGICADSTGCADYVKRFGKVQA